MPTQIWEWPKHHRPPRCSAGQKDGACLSSPQIWMGTVTLQARPCSWRPCRRSCKLSKNGSRSQTSALRCQDVLLASAVAGKTLQVAKSEGCCSFDTLKMRMNGLASSLLYTQTSLVYHVCRTLRAMSTSTSRQRTMLWQKKCCGRIRCLLMSMKSSSGAKRLRHHI